MIVVLDTNALHSDTYATGPTVQTFLGAAEDGAYEIWVPSVVIEELVRQFPERFEKLTEAVKKSHYEARALGLGLPEVATDEDPVPVYRDRLTQNLTREGVKIVGPPERAGLIAEWIAQRRMPIPGNGRGAVDTQIWLTAVEAGEEDECILIARNPKDFADLQNDRRELHPALKADMERFGLDEDAITLCPTVLDFLQSHIEPSREAMGKARALLSDRRRRDDLVKEIEGAVEWFPLEPRAEEWMGAFGGVDIDDASLVAFDIEVLSIVRADPDQAKTHVILEAYGTASLGLALFKYEADSLPEDSDISIEDWDLNESMASGSATVSASLTVDVILEDAGLAVALDGVEPIGTDDVFTLLESSAEENPEVFLAAVSSAFDVSGTQVATGMNLTSVEKFDFRAGALLARVDFSVDYDNPVDSEDEFMSASNVTDVTLDLKIADPDFERGTVGEIFAVEGVFPD